MAFPSRPSAKPDAKRKVSSSKSKLRVQCAHNLCIISSVMIRRLYVHNFRCLENFELPISGRPSALLIGKNGAGKTTIGLALEILQKIGRGTNRVGDLVKPKSFFNANIDEPEHIYGPMRFE